MPPADRAPDTAGASGVPAASGTAVPAWLAELGRKAAADRPPELARYHDPIPPGARPSAVLLVFGESEGESAGAGEGADAGEEGPGPDLLFVQRSSGLRDHPGQVAFPGGGAHAEDADIVGTALRETQEETGLDPAAVSIVTALPPLNLAFSGHVVTPVLGWWGVGSALAGDEQEIESVHRVPLAELAAPRARLRVRFPDGYLAPGFLAGNLFVYGFTGSLVSWLLRLGGWERPWDTGRIEDENADRRHGGRAPGPGVRASARRG